MLQYYIHMVEFPISVHIHIQIISPPKHNARSASIPVKDHHHPCEDLPNQLAFLGRERQEVPSSVCLHHVHIAHLLKTITQ